MSKKLGILITHYKEPQEVVRPMLTSIAMQQGISFEDVEVIIVNDGKDGLLPESFLQSFPYEIQYLVMPHGGVSKARNYALDHSTADYVMFCDCDDMFLNMYAFHMIFSALQEGFETCVSTFIEELKDEEGNYKIIRHDKDITFVHGKIHNRQFLVDNKLRFDNSLTVHEDGYFNSLVHVVAESVKKIETPFYIWRWNANSVVRKDSTLLLYKTYGNLMDGRIATCRQFRDRGYIAEFMDAVAKTVFDSYYDFQKPDALKPENKELIKQAEKHFKRFYDEFKDTYHECNITRLGEIAQLTRTTAYCHGLRVESQTIREWLNHITKEVK